MPCHTRMKTIFSKGLLWLYLFGFGLMVVSLEPGYLDFDNLPDTNFSCKDKVIGGYYADLETSCQMFHVCTYGQHGEHMDIRFLCLNGTVFDQETRVCERIDEVDCSKSEQFYNLNLELYGNTQPPIVEEAPETVQPPPQIKSTTTTTTTTSKPIYYSSSRSTTTTGSSHHFPVPIASDFRFNPEEINVSLNLNSPPDIRSKGATYQQHDDRAKHVLVTTVGTKLPIATQKILVPTSQPKSVSYDLTHILNSKPTEVNQDFQYQDADGNVEYDDDLPQHNYQYHSSVPNFRPTASEAIIYDRNEQPYKSSTVRAIYHTTTAPLKVHLYNQRPTTFRSHPAVSSSMKSVPQYHYQETDKPARIPILSSPLPLSSPAPFSASPHEESKRHTKIIYSLGTSVTDETGRKLNHSLRTIDDIHNFETATPPSYEDYKEEEISSNPFYHDVPKLQNRRQKRAAEQNNTIIKDDKEAIDILRFLLNWYTTYDQSTVSIPLASETITQINNELSFTKPGASDIKAVSDDKNSSSLDEVKAKLKLALEASNEDQYEDEDSDERLDQRVEGLKNKFKTLLPASNETLDEKSDDDSEYEYEYEEDVEVSTVLSKNLSTLNETETAVNKTTVHVASTTESNKLSVDEYVDDNYEQVGNTSMNQNGDAYNKSRNMETTRIFTDVYVDDNYEANAYKGSSNHFEITKTKNETSKLLKHTTVAKETNEFGRKDRKESHVDDLSKQNYNNDESSKYKDESTEEKQLTKNETTKPLKHTTVAKKTNEFGGKDRKESHVDDLSKQNYNNDEGSKYKDESTEEKQKTIDSIDAVPLDYVDDNYEPLTYKDSNQANNVSKLNEQPIDSKPPDYVDDNYEPLTYKDSSKVTSNKTLSNNEGMKETLEYKKGDKYTDIKLNKTNVSESTKNAVGLKEKVNFPSEKEYNVDTEIIAPVTEDNIDKYTNHLSQTEYTTDTSTYAYNSDNLLLKDNADGEDKTTTDSDALFTTIPYPTQIFTDKTFTSTESYSTQESTISFLTTLEKMESTQSSSTSELDLSTYSTFSSVEHNTENNLDIVTTPSHNTEGDMSTVTNYELQELVQDVETSTKSIATTILISSTELPVTSTEGTESTLFVNTEPSLTFTEYPVTTAKEFSSTYGYESTITTPKTVETTSRHHSIRTRPTRFNRRPTTPARRGNYHRFDVHNRRRYDRRKPYVQDNVESVTNKTVVTQQTPKLLSVNNVYNTSNSVKNNLEVSGGSKNLSSSVVNKDFTTKLSDTKVKNHESSSQNAIRIDKNREVVILNQDEEVTDPSFSRSANPTLSKENKELLATTPLSRIIRIKLRKESPDKNFMFNCFDKKLKRFYSDPRDCRLFHYCTPGYTKNQLLDMKFVCESGTYFDEIKLICTKEKPSRCL